MSLFFVCLETCFFLENHDAYRTDQCKKKRSCIANLYSKTKIENKTRRKSFRKRTNPKKERGRGEGGHCEALKSKKKVYLKQTKPRQGKHSQGFQVPLAPCSLHVTTRSGTSDFGDFWSSHASRRCESQRRRRHRRKQSHWWLRGRAHGRRLGFLGVSDPFPPAKLHAKKIFVRLFFFLWGGGVVFLFFLSFFLLDFFIDRVA